MPDRKYDFGGVHGPVHAGNGDLNYVGRGSNVAYGPQHNAGRDVVASGGPHADLLAEIVNLKQTLAALRLTVDERQAAEHELAAAEGVVRTDQPDLEAAGHHVGRFVQRLQEAGALATAGTSLIESIRKIASWLGPLGVTFGQL